MAVGGLVLCVAETSANMVLNVQDVRVFCHNGGAVFSYLSNFSFEKSLQMEIYFVFVFQGYKIMHSKNNVQIKAQFYTFLGNGLSIFNTSVHGFNTLGIKCVQH